MLAGIGLTLGPVIWAAAASVGLGLLSQLAWLQEWLRLLGGAYLIYLGFRKLWGSGQASRSLHATTNWQAFRAGVLLNLANPYCTSVGFLRRCCRPIPRPGSVRQP
ncbi:LysE family transporter [Mesorhizobium sp. M1423]|uniref:LysE family translocator n=1 Tax=Mesorhizobium sp. M1423 TaxID=2957101 RepID=UPI00333735A1